MRQSQNHLLGLALRDLAEIDGMLEPDREGWRGKRLFLTGGTGFFGRWLLAALHHANREHALGVEVTVLSRKPGAFLERHPEIAAWPGFHFQEGCVTELAPAASRCDYVLHAAADTTAFGTQAGEDERSRAIELGTQRVLAFAKAAAASRLLLVSSGAVYGARAGQPSGAREEDAAGAEPLTPYGRAKQAAERLCAESGMDHVIARAFAFLGPYLPLDAHFAAGNFLRDARQGGPIVVKGDGTTVRSYLYPTDLVVWLLRILLRGARGAAYNVGSDEAVTTAQLARRVAAAVTPSPEVRVGSDLGPGPQNIYLPNLQRTRTELGLTLTVPLREAIARTLAFLDSAA